MAQIAAENRLRDASALDAVGHTLWFIAQEGWRNLGQDFFAILVRHLAETLDCECAMVGKVEGDSPTQVDTVAFYLRGEIVPNISYDLAGTPCQNVVADVLCCHREAIQSLYPADDMLVDIGAESYVGIPLWSSRGRVIGLIAVIGSRPLADSDLAQQILQIVALRASSALERQLTDAAQARSEQEFRNLFNYSTDAIYLIDPVTRKILDANPQASKMLGYTRDELVALTLTDLHPPSASSFVAERVENTFAGSTEPFETEHVHKDGRRVPVEVSSQCVDVSGTRCEAKVIQAFVRDIGRRKEAETAKDELQARLLRSQKFEAMGKLAGGVAHDFNNMLGIILGQVEFALLETAESDPRYECLQAIEDATMRSAELTRQLLAFARQQRTAPRTLCLNDAVSGSLKMLLHLVGDSVDLRWSPGTGLWPVLLDPGQVDQILTNLCVNARDAMRAQGRITIATANRAFANGQPKGRTAIPAGDYVQLTVHDTGEGMDAELLDKIFEPFFTTKDAGEGTGLGLATVYGIVKQNGGFIFVDSEKGEGSTFEVYFPHHPANAGDKAPALEKASPGM